MRLQPSRLRTGEWVVGAASVVLLVCLFFLPWYGQTSTYAGVDRALGVAVNADGFQSLTVLRFLVLVVGLLGLAAWWLQATRPSPALPICMTVLTWGFSFALFVCLFVRTLIDEPKVIEVGSGGMNTIDAKYGAYLALATTLAIFLGAYRSLRQDGVASADAPQKIETLRLVRPADRAPRSPSASG